MKLREVPIQYHPDYRLQDGSAGDAELIASIIRTGTKHLTVLDIANNLIYAFAGLEGLAKASLQEIASVPGMSQAKACQIQASLKLARKLQVSDIYSNAPRIGTPSCIAERFMQQFIGSEQEELHVVNLNNKNVILSASMIYRGASNQIYCFPADVFRVALRAGATAIVLVHNHPSGDPTPSPDDVRATEVMLEAGKMLDIEVLDHIVIGRNRWKSLRELGLGWK